MVPIYIDYFNFYLLIRKKFFNNKLDNISFLHIQKNLKKMIIKM